MKELHYVEEYRTSLDLHIRYVREAGRRLGVPKILLIEHDRSKFSPDEFKIYAKHFKGGGAPNDFPLAWLHHIHHNPHHWQYWIFPDRWTMGDKMEGAKLPMPHNYLLEMVADWMGASRGYTGDWDMTDWLEKNLPMIKIHSQTYSELCKVLDSLGYPDTVYAIT